MPVLLKHYVQHKGQDKLLPDAMELLLKEFGTHNIPGKDEVKMLKDVIHAF